jgi:hypothetical protein
LQQLFSFLIGYDLLVQRFSPINFHTADFSDDVIPNRIKVYSCQLDFPFAKRFAFGLNNFVDPVNCHMRLTIIL